MSSPTTKVLTGLGGSVCGGSLSKPREANSVPRHCTTSIAVRPPSEAPLCKLSEKHHAYQESGNIRMISSHLSRITYFFFHNDSYGIKLPTTSVNVFCTLDHSKACTWFQKTDQSTSCCTLRTNASTSTLSTTAKMASAAGPTPAA